MARKARRRRRNASRLIRNIVLLGLMIAAAFYGKNWLQDHPQHNPFAPLDLRDPIGMATVTKLVALRTDISECRAVLDRSGVGYTSLPPSGEGPCARPDQTQLSSYPLKPDTPAVTCPVAAALEMWRTNSLDPAARKILGSEIVRIEHMGVYNCRRIRGSGSNAWSQHATGNAIDISAFVLADGRRISVLKDWGGDTERGRFLRSIRDDACDVFATVLSPDFNAAHADHFHLDQGGSWASVCR